MNRLLLIIRFFTNQARIDTPEAIIEIQLQKLENELEKLSDDPSSQDYQALMEEITFCRRKLSILKKRVTA